MSLVSESCVFCEALLGRDYQQSVRDDRCTETYCGRMRRPHPSYIYFWASISPPKYLVGEASEPLNINGDPTPSVCYVMSVICDEQPSSSGTPRTGVA